MHKDIEFPIYHNVYGEGRLLEILKADVLKKHSHPGIKAVCLTRSKTYLSNRRIQMVFDYYQLKHNMKIKPIHCVVSKKDEMEERVYSDIKLSKYLKLLLIDGHPIDVKNYLLINQY